MKIISNKKIFIIVPELKFFLSHRLQLVRGLVQQGWNFVIVTSYDLKPEDEPGIRYEIFDTHRKRFSFTNLIYNGLRLIKLIQLENPNLIYAVSHRSIFLARLANFFVRKKSIYAISGMGSLFSSKLDLKKSLKNSTLQIVVTYIYKYLIRSKNSNFLLQNKDDLEFLIKSNITNINKVFKIEGNGIEASKFSNEQAPISSTKFIMISRLLRDKGVLEFLQAAKSVVNKYHDRNCKFILYGDIDDANFNSLSLTDIQPYLTSNITYAGFNSDIQTCIKNSSVVVLPSYREGFSKVLMEAQASARPVITSNVTGCKDAILNGSTGFLVEPMNANDLQEKIEFFILNSDLVFDMGQAAYEHAVNNFTIQKAIDEHIEMFSAILSD
jgi:glycosyltransferase involved in cell wall biosynthesis